MQGDLKVDPSVIADCVACFLAELTGKAIAISKFQRYILETINLAKS
jgi:hypothetical protein